MVKNIFPKIGGRLRLAHEENDQLSITTDIIKYDENLAVVKAITSTMKGNFPGIGMASVDREGIKVRILSLRKDRPLRNADIRNFTDLGRQQAYRIMKELESDDLVYQEGHGQAGRPSGGCTANGVLPCFKGRGKVVLNERPRCRASKVLFAVLAEIALPKVRA